MLRLRTLNTHTLLVGSLVVALFAWIYFTGIAAPSFEGEKLVTVEQGETLSTTALLLEEEGVVRSAFWLKLLVRMRADEQFVHAGDYLFHTPRSAFTVARIITTGAFGLEPIRVTVPEGATRADMAIIFDRRLYKFDPEAFLRETEGLEGYLFPDTYHFLPNTTHAQVIKTLRDTFEIYIEQHASAIEASGYTLHEILTLASIIEKEASIHRDRQLISGVLHNRLDIDMLLQVDATFFYTHDKGSYDITRAELRDADNLYNTYVHKGLPPGPIGTASDSSIDAALNPIENEYLFYLADRSGVTYYSRTYEQHLIKKARYVDE